MLLVGMKPQELLAEVSDDLKKIAAWFPSQHAIAHRWMFKQKLPAWFCTQYKSARNNVWKIMWEIQSRKFPTGALVEYTTINGNKTSLTGAGFTLYKEVATKTADAKTGAEIKAELAALNAAIKAAALKDDAYYEIAAEVKVDADGDTFSFEGVDDGNYVLVETTIPEGYNAWNAVEFEISAKHDVASADPKLTSLTGGDLATGEFKDTGIIDTDIINKSGLELPETGGIGTTIFYIVGSLLVVAAVVLLVTKKRMATVE